MFGYKLVKEKDIPYLRRIEAEEIKNIKVYNKGLRIGISFDKTNFFIMNKDIKPIQLIYLDLKALRWLHESITQILEDQNKNKEASGTDNADL